MSESIFETVANRCSSLRVDFTSSEFAMLAEKHEMTDAEINAISNVIEYLWEKKSEATVRMLLKTSGLPLRHPRTFDNFDFSVIKGKNVEKLKNLSSLTTIYAHRNVAFIGPPGTGKTHLAQAYGYECCRRGIKAYFIKMSELRDKFSAARNAGRVAAVLGSLVRPACLIIDEVGHCEFDKENTRLFFDLIDRRYNKEGAFNTVFTSNKSPSSWRDNFHEEDSLLCALDRIFDDATVFNIRGESYRGKKLDTVALQTEKIKSPAKVTDYLPK